jgi:hypothetical protein
MLRNENSTILSGMVCCLGNFPVYKTGTVTTKKGIGCDTLL